MNGKADGSKDSLLIVAFGLAALYSTWLLGPLINPNHLLLYHWAGSACRLFLPPVLDFILGWLVLAFVLITFRWSGGWERFGWNFLLCFTPWLLLKNIGLLDLSLESTRLSRLLLALGIAAFVFLFFRTKHKENWHRNGKVFLTKLAKVSAIFGVAVLAQVAWFTWQARNINADAPAQFAAHASPQSPAQQRVFFIVLDELSFQQVYGQRPANLRLPEFDHLAAEGTVFTHVIAAGPDTERVLPALLTGAEVAEVKATAKGLLQTRGADTGRWSPFDQHNTIFQDAIAHGRESALVGWYNPYCRILPAVLESCSWYLGISGNLMEYRSSIASNMLALLRSELLQSRWFRPLQKAFPLSDGTLQGTAEHIADYEALNRDSLEVMGRPEISFVMLHLPVPHPPGIYRRSSGQFVMQHSSYLDNLALADKMLAGFESRLREASQWDSATVVIMGDHGWRPDALWKNWPGWTDEDDQASRTETLNHRPAMLVKMPAQTTGTRIDEPFRAVQTRRLINAFFNGRLSTSEDLHEWVVRNP